MARVALRESKIRAQRRRRRVMLGIIAVALFVAVFGALALLSEEQFWRISRLSIVGTHGVATSTIDSVVRQAIAGDYLYLFPKDNVIIYPKEAVAAALLSQVPSLASVSISADTFDTLKVSVVEREPKALWCGADPSAGLPCFLLDESGVAYAGDLSFAGDAYKKYYGALTGSSTPKQFLSPSAFRSLSALVDTIATSQKSDVVKSVWVDQNKDVHVIFASNFELRFALAADGGDLYQRFTLALQSDPFKQHKISDFEYLDLRFGDKLYYKLR